MAYANLVNITCTDKEEFFQRLRDFVCKRNGTYDYSSTGIGWTLHDSVYATDEDNCAINDYFVIYSPGEGGDDDLYFKIVWTTSYIKCYGYQSWDNSTHTGGNVYAYNVSNFIVSETGTYILWIYGNLNALLFLNDLMSTDCRGVSFGRMDKGYDDLSETVATCSTTLTAGSDVSIVVDAVPSNWAVDKEIYIRTTHDDAISTVKMEKITIKTLSGTTLTADLTNSYTTGSKLSDFVGYYAEAATTLFTAGYTIIGPDGTLNLAYTTGVYLGLSTTAHDPDEYEERFYMLEYVCSSSVGLVGKIPLIKRVPSFVSGFAIGDILEDVDGVNWRCFMGYSTQYACVKEV